MLSKNARYAFNFCVRWNFMLAKLATERQNCMVRFCYVTTQKYRMYLTLSPKGLRYAPCIKGENQWVPVAVEKRVALPDAATLFSDVKTLEKEMVGAFFMQFPRAEETFFDNLPTCREVRTVLEQNPLGSELVKQFYIFTRFEEMDVGDADGVVDILVEEGTLSIPYENCKPDWKNDFELQMYRSLLHPDSKLAYINQCFWDLFDGVWGRIRSISWGGFRRLIDKTIQ